MKESHIPEVKHLKEMVEQAAREANRLARLRINHEWPFEAAEACQSLSETLQLAETLTRTLYAATPSSWQIDENVIRPRRWSRE